MTATGFQKKRGGGGGGGGIHSTKTRHFGINFHGSSKKNLNWGFKKKNSFKKLASKDSPCQQMNFFL